MRTVEAESVPWVSVVIPTYNRANSVCDAIASVLSQTYQNIEVIVVDDGSTDETATRLKQFDQRIRLIVTRNSGAAAARNRGIDVARGQFVSFLDSDDLWLPTKLERQMNALSKLGDDFGVCFTDCRYVGNPNISASAFEAAGLESKTEYSPLDSPMTWVLAKHTAMYLQGLVVKRSLLQEIQGFDEYLVVSEDTDLLFRLALRTRLCFVDEKLVEIDRNPVRPFGLMEMFSRRTERMYLSRQHMFKKWLTLPELSDSGVREKISIHQREMLYEWLITKLYRLDFPSAFSKAKQLGETGEPFLTIGFKLFQRVIRKLCFADSD